MGSNLDIRKSLATFVTVEATDTVASALNKLRESSREFILITAKLNPHEEEDQPVCLLRVSELIAIADDESQELTALLGKCPDLLVLSEEDLTGEEFSAEVLSTLAQTLAAGCVIRLRDGTLGILPADSIARSLPFKDIAFVHTRMTVGVPARTYICRKCKPPRRKRPRVSVAPECDVWPHGTMQPV